jgi:hypothetical protein
MGVPKLLPIVAGCRARLVTERLWTPVFAAATLLILPQGALAESTPRMPAGVYKPPTIPSYVVQSADSILRERVGQRYFDKHFTLERESCHYRSYRAESLVFSPEEFKGVEPYWGVVYRYRVPGKSFIHELVQVSVTLAGRLHPWDNDLAVGDCAHNPLECEFPIDERGASRIARDAGLKQGIKPWETGFTWNRSHGFIWGVRNTLSVRADSCSSEGQVFLIDANTGDLIAEHHWGSICCFGQSPIVPPAPADPPPPFPPSSPIAPGK